MPIRLVDKVFNFLPAPLLLTRVEGLFPVEGFALVGLAAEGGSLAGVRVLPRLSLGGVADLALNGRDLLNDLLVEEDVLLVLLLLHLRSVELRLRFSRDADVHVRSHRLRRLPDVNDCLLVDAASFLLWRALQDLKKPLLTRAARPKLRVSRPLCFSALHGADVAVEECLAGRLDDWPDQPGLAVICKLRLATCIRLTGLLCR